MSEIAMFKCCRCHFAYTIVKNNNAKWLARPQEPEYCYNPADALNEHGEVLPCAHKRCGNCIDLDNQGGYLQYCDGEQSGLDGRLPVRVRLATEYGDEVRRRMRTEMILLKRRAMYAERGARAEVGAANANEDPFSVSGIDREVFYPERLVSDESNHTGPHTSNRDQRPPPDDRYAIAFLLSNQHQDYPTPREEANSSPPDNSN
ncbi:hypothetical protein DL95DRAFT_470564 [Leptodontidium sp. 2 PMI_412]|nr:hypothetical protein DL95DRAFT_470564 [Leptodontidium sp. 2 PMI_412]